MVLEIVDDAVDARARWHSQMNAVALRTANEFWSLTAAREYSVIGLDYESYRVVDDYGEPIVLPKLGFRIVDEAIPDEWVWDRYSDDEYCSGPKELEIGGFHERYFDGEREVMATFAGFRFRRPRSQI
jgi:hypothetical protein